MSNQPLEDALTRALLDTHGRYDSKQDQAKKIAELLEAAGVLTVPEPPKNAPNADDDYWWGVIFGDHLAFGVVDFGARGVTFRNVSKATHDSWSTRTEGAQLTPETLSQLEAYIDSLPDEEEYGDE